MQFIPAYHNSGQGNVPPTRVVIHGTVSPCVRGGARSTAYYFQSPNSGGSAHMVADPGEVVRCATDNTICWHAPPNQHSLGIELCDPVAGNPSRWNDADHVSMLHLAAAEVRNWCNIYNIPKVKIGPRELLAGQRGICGHVDISQAWHQTDHTDPGPGFPWDVFIALVNNNLPSTGQDNSMTADELYMTRISFVNTMFRIYLGRDVDGRSLLVNVAAMVNGMSPQQVQTGIANSPEAKAFAARKK